MASTQASSATSFETRQLGNSDLRLTPIGYGAWAIGGGNWEFAWGAQDDDESVRTIERALDAGINWIDTAAIYGLGHSEEVVAKALAKSPHKPYVFTKCSMRWKWRPQDLSQSEGGISQGRTGELAAQAESGCDRPLPDSLAESRRRRSKRDGRRWRGSRSRARFATSACRTSMSSR